MNQPTKIFVTGFPPDIRSKHIETIFSEFGRIIFSDINKGKGCIVYDSERGAKSAVNSIDSSYQFGKKIYVDLIPSTRPTIHKRSHRTHSHSNSQISYSRSRSRSHHRKNHSHSQTIKKRPTSVDKCFVCGEFGHWASQCPKGDGTGVQSGKCFKCGERGHIAKKCPNFRKKSQARTYSRSGSKQQKSKWRSSSSKSSKSSKSRSKSRQKSSSSSISGSGKKNGKSASFSKSKSNRSKSGKS